MSCFTIIKEGIFVQIGPCWHNTRLLSIKIISSYAATISPMISIELRAFLTYSINYAFLLLLLFENCILDRYRFSHILIIDRLIYGCQVRLALVVLNYLI